MNKIVLLVVSAVLCLTSELKSQGYFSYDSGSQTLTLNSYIQFTIPSDFTAAYGIGFAVTNSFSSSQIPGSMQFFPSSGFSLTDSLGAISSVSSINASIPALIAPNTAQLNDTTLTLFFNLGDTTLLPSGDVITLSAGSGGSSLFGYVTPSNIAPSLPVTIHDGNDKLIANVFSIPEPSSYALLGLGTLILIVAYRLRA